MLLSIVSHCRMDNWMDNFKWRIETTINKYGDNTKNYELDGDNGIEIILVDWGSNKSHKAINELNINNNCKKRLKYVWVEEELAKQYDKDSPYSSVHAMNTGVRRSTGKYILSVDSDVYCQQDMINKLIETYIKNGNVAGNDLNTTFYWAARRHVPKQFNINCPPTTELDNYINANWETFVCDKPNKHMFLGAACALLTTHDVWFNSRGLDERLIYVGWSDINMHRRLTMKYSWGDLDDHGIRFYHLEHHPDSRNRTVTRKSNEQINAESFEANDENWGLGNHNIDIVTF